ncbi:MAG: sulfurtransferase complex subunit TusB [Alteromonadaceae bacterium]|nr:sulfurtransferase complex subunit TusB [Alteromonadaceae bacterium]
MSLLHLVRSSAFDSNDFAQCINNILPNDKIVLMDDACYNINHPLIEKAIDKVSTTSIYALKQHVLARAIANNNIMEITMNELTKMTFELDSVITWQ